jgi:transposase
MIEISTIGLDIAKNVFQVHGVDGAGAVTVRRQLRRAELLKFFGSLPACVVGIEACATSHYWARRIAELGHEVRLLPPAHVKAYVKRGKKNDAADAAAICEAVTRPHMRTVPIKTEAQQATLLLHRARDLLVRQRTMLICALRSHMAEFGVIAGQGRGNFVKLAACLNGKEDCSLPELARSARTGLQAAISPNERLQQLFHARQTAGDAGCQRADRRVGRTVFRRKRTSIFPWSKSAPSWRPCLYGNRDVRRLINTVLLCGPEVSALCHPSLGTVP